MTTSCTETPRIFLTDYASYNNGTQFQFGHWVDLDQFTDADDLLEYIRKHFEEADRKSPIDIYTKREEIMITDFEGFPREFYSESMDFEPLFDYLALEDFEKVAHAICLELDISPKEARDLNYREGSSSNWQDVEGFYEEVYPEVIEAINNTPYCSFDWEQFARECLYEVEVNGTDYLIWRD